VKSGRRPNRPNNDWIPTKAVTVLDNIKTECKGILTEKAVSQILYQLNDVWRGIMRTECEAVKKKAQVQI
jgi:hypothetical protein